MSRVPQEIDFMVEYSKPRLSRERILDAENDIVSVITLLMSLSKVFMSASRRVKQRFLTIRNGVKFPEALRVEGNGRKTEAKNRG